MNNKMYIEHIYRESWQFEVICSICKNKMLVMNVDDKDDKFTATTEPCKHCLTEVADRQYISILRKENDSAK